MDCTTRVQQYRCKLQGQCLANNWSKNREKATNNSSRVCRYWIKKRHLQQNKKNHNYNRIGKTDRWRHDNGESEIHMETVTAYTFAPTNVGGEWLISMLKITLEGKWVSSGGSCGSILEPFIGRGEGPHLFTNFRDWKEHQSWLWRINLSAAMSDQWAWPLEFMYRNDGRRQGEKWSLFY